MPNDTCYNLYYVIIRKHVRFRCRKPLWIILAKRLKVSLQRGSQFSIWVYRAGYLLFFQTACCFSGWSSTDQHQHLGLLRTIVQSLYMVITIQFYSFYFKGNLSISQEKRATGLRNVHYFSSLVDSIRLIYHFFPSRTCIYWSKDLSHVYYKVNLRSRRQYEKNESILTI